MAMAWTVPRWLVISFLKGTLASAYPGYRSVSIGSMVLKYGACWHTMFEKLSAPKALNAASEEALRMSAFV
jgi:hypothetical protein|tara:strand:- start:158 stop:370 length:213 start_codon:yes stop_codon:yes gene_type:complete